jgi:hypothetical protein
VSRRRRRRHRKEQHTQHAMVASSLHLHATTVAIKRRDSHERVANAEDDNKHESRLQPFGRLVVSSLHLHATTVTIKRRDSHDIKEESTTAVWKAVDPDFYENHLQEGIPSTSSSAYDKFYNSKYVRSSTVSVVYCITLCMICCIKGITFIPFRFECRRDHNHRSPKIYFSPRSMVIRDSALWCFCSTASFLNAPVMLPKHY